MKILHTLRQAHLGGGETFVKNLIKYLPQQKFQNYFLSFQDGPMLEELRSNGVETFLVSSKTPFDLRTYGAVKKVMEKVNPDVVHMHGTRAASNSILPAKKLNIPTLYTVNAWSWHPGLSSLQKLLRKKSERFLVRNSDSTVCGSFSDQNIGKKDLGVECEYVVHNSVPFDKFPFYDRDFVRENLGFSPEDFVFLFLGRNTEQKNPLLVMEAFEKVYDKYPHAKLLFVGSGDLDWEVEQKIKTLKSKSAIKRHNETSIPSFYRAASDLFILPSLWEAFSLALLESIAESLPVLASDIAPNKELLKDGLFGGLFQSENVEDLAQEMMKAIKQPEILQTKAMDALVFAKSYYSIEALINDYSQIYQNLKK